MENKAAGFEMTTTNAQDIYDAPHQTLQRPSSYDAKLFGGGKVALSISQGLIILLLVAVVALNVVLLLKDCNCSSTTATNSNQVVESSISMLNRTCSAVTTYGLKLNEILATSKESEQNIDNVVNILSNHSTTTASLMSDTLAQIKRLSARSCMEVKELSPNSSSGIYLFAHPEGNGYSYSYCHMGTLCGSGGGWTRLAYLNMSNPTEQCPNGLRLYQSGGVRVCGRPTSNVGSCASVFFSSNGISYSQVCGRVVGYQYGSTDALHIRYNLQLETSIDSYYMDGVSITRGSPRQHVWTLMAGLGDSYFDGTYNCPCNGGSNVVPPAFVGNDYFCESGNPNQSYAEVLYTSDPLWDGQGCGTLEGAGTCCSAPGLPWFHRDYGNTKTTDYLELRVCAEESTTNEDAPVHFYEIYVK